MQIIFENYIDYYINRSTIYSLYHIIQHIVITFNHNSYFLNSCCSPFQYNFSFYEMGNTYFLFAGTIILPPDPDSLSANSWDHGLKGSFLCLKQNDFYKFNQNQSILWGFLILPNGSEYLWISFQLKSNQKSRIKVY